MSEAEDLIRNRLSQSRSLRLNSSVQRSKASDQMIPYASYEGFDVKTGQPLTRSVGGEPVRHGQILTNGLIQPGAAVLATMNTVDGMPRPPQVIPGLESHQPRPVSVLGFSYETLYGVGTSGKLFNSKFYPKPLHRFKLSQLGATLNYFNFFDNYEDYGLY